MSLCECQLSPTALTCECRPESPSFARRYGIQSVATAINAGSDAATAPRGDCNCRQNLTAQLATRTYSRRRAITYVPPRATSYDTNYARTSGRTLAVVTHLSVILNYVTHVLGRMGDVTVEGWCQATGVGVGAPDAAVREATPRETETRRHSYRLFL